MECAHFIMDQLQLSKNAFNGFKYDKFSKNCALGVVGPFAGDVNFLSDENKMEGVYIIPNCSASSKFLTASIVITSGLRNYFVVVIVVVLVVGSNAKCDVIRRIVVAKCNRT